MAYGTYSRSRVLTAATCLVATAVLGGITGCGKNSAGSASSGTVSVWALEDAQNQPIIQAGIDEFNKTSKTKLQLVTYANDDYKKKLQDSMGGRTAPDIFFNWGGGNLAQYVQAGSVVDLGPTLAKSSSTSGAFLPSVLASGMVDGKQYGLPMNGMQPVLLFYNKDVFTAAGLQPPKTYDDLLSLVDAFKARGVVPMALAGSQGWTELMYLEYLLDRVGGPDKFAAIAAGKAGAWRDPAVLQALQMCQDLAKRGAFGADFATVNYDNTGASRMLATGKAAMHLMGSWEYSSQLRSNPDFARSGSLGWTTFPTVSGGTGNPKNIVGNPSNYFSVRADGQHVDVAKEFLVKTLTSGSYVDGLVKSGQVPPVKDAENKITTLLNVNSSFTSFTYQLVGNAPSFTQSWDQALSPEAGTQLNANLQKLFGSQLSPQDLVTAMEKIK